MQRVRVLTVCLLLTCCLAPCDRLSAQKPDAAKAAQPGEKAEILFAASSPDTSFDENGKPSLATLDPIAFLVHGEPRNCYSSTSSADKDPVLKITLATLRSAYTAGRKYPLWWRGAPWGTVEAVKSCIEGSETDDDVLDLDGYFQFHSDSGQLHSKLQGIVIL